ncbi:PEGA domain-containing protein [Deinococcus soli (ex Cha et al. 2016)]|uniref:PEGA domain-containing protein n=1 Tax=Deinococcus soli (ex Cha et al. 2016) TaxID=1309411 RepID=UPI001665D4F2|nr:PEGA domain-containing protein [Deinococcus soli (ex Cha et al. 2016)]
MEQTRTRTAPTQYLPAHQDLQACVDDLYALWYVAIDQKRKDQAKAIFDAHPGAQTNLTLALEVQRLMRELLGYPIGPEPALDLPPFGDAPAVTTTAVPEPHSAAPTPAPNSPVTPAPGEAEPDGGPDDEDTPDEDGAEPPSLEPTAPAQDATAAPAPRVDPTLWAEGMLGRGLISGLASTLAVGDTMQLVLTRTASGELLATVVPTRLNGELAGTCTDLQAKGTPAQLDDELLDAAGTYREVRKTARELAEELLASTVAAAAAAKSAPKVADKTKKPDDTKTQRATLTVTPNVNGAVVTLKNDAGSHSPVNGKGFPLDPGTYTIRVEAVGYETHEETVELKPKDTKSVAITMRTAGLF